MADGKLFVLQREVEREIRALERTEQQLIADIKKENKRGNQVTMQLVVHSYSICELLCLMRGPFVVVLFLQQLGGKAGSGESACEAAGGYAAAEGAADDGHEQNAVHAVPDSGANAEQSKRMRLDWGKAPQTHSTIIILCAGDGGDPHVGHGDGRSHEGAKPFL